MKKQIIYYQLNFCLDIVIAEAVTEFNRGQRENAERDEVQRLGFLEHRFSIQNHDQKPNFLVLQQGMFGCIRR